ncbi:rhomboid-like protein [Prescottella subtropica]|uniref:rhomboid-like protein n=1 Tax=Prescottella subtropica TaxID=2545757 RepID=UPI0010F4E962|nr:rhomboid-like protein [Prescottella subtropica]
MVWAYVRRAPGTFAWLAILLVTTIVMHRLSEPTLTHVLGSRSTNLHHLREDPLRVLVTSLFWLSGGGWLGYVVLFNVFHVPVERWLGTWRWLAVVVIAHVGATYLSEGVLYWAIRVGQAPASAVNTLDVGVSYGLAGVTAVLAYRLVRPWRYWYVAGVLVVYAVPLFGTLTFTDIGHFAAVLIGFACYPLTRARPGVWDPGEWASGVRAWVVSRGRPVEHG